MKSSHAILSSSALVVAASASLFAQDKPAANASAAGAGAAATAPSAKPASAGIVNDWLRDKSTAFNAWDIGGQFRIRYEDKENFGVSGATDFRKTGVVNDNSFLLLREKAHVGYSPCPWFTAYVEGRNSSSTGDKRNPNPESDLIDLHQAYFALGSPDQFPLTAKIGRQELRYGDERIIGAFDWSNIGRVFDAAILRFEQPDFWVDGFVGRVVIPDDNNFNLPNHHDFLSGIYASTRTLVPKQETQLYFLSRNVEPGSATASRDVYTIGLRVKSLPGEFGGWDYGTELAGQFGSFNVAGARLEHEAIAASIGGGYTWADCSCAPRLGIEYNFASGDDNPGDGKHHTFDNHFPTNHKFYGYMDFFSWQNMHDLRLMSSAKPAKKLTLTADYHMFWLVEPNDFFYQVNGNPRVSAGATAGGNNGYSNNQPYGRYVGSEIDLVATYNLARTANLQAGYAHFFAGDYVKSSLSGIGGASDADFVYLQMALNF